MSQVIKSYESVKIKNYEVEHLDEDIEYDINEYTFYPKSNHFIELNIIVNWNHYTRGTRIINIVYNNTNTISQSFCPKSYSKHNQYAYFKIPNVTKFHIELYQNSGVNINCNILLTILSQKLINKELVQQSIILPDTSLSEPLKDNQLKDNPYKTYNTDKIEDNTYNTDASLILPYDKYINNLSIIKNKNRNKNSSNFETNFIINRNL